MRVFPWRIEYKDEPYYSLWNGNETHGHGFFEITYFNMKYGVFGKDSLNGKSTEHILTLVSNMLNDAHNLALEKGQSNE
jgi:hypothetical protein